jgi:light-regulated signal transduction histidine kinase (bacteriophytochrome)
MLSEQPGDGPAVARNQEERSDGERERPIADHGPSTTHVPEFRDAPMRPCGRGAGAVTPRDGAAMEVESSDLTACDREPIHIPGSIQPHGVLLVVDPATDEVLQAACGPSADEVLRGDPIGKRLRDVLDPEIAALADGLPSRAVEGQSCHFGVVRKDGAVHHLVAHLSQGMLIVELERMEVAESGTFDEVQPRIREFLEALQRTVSTEELSVIAAREIRRITGLDRVLVYRFDDDWNGAVIAEDRNDVLPSYLDLRFPASDIPAQARELYRLNRLRLIADAGYQPVPIRPTLNPGTNRPVDLSFAVLRSVSPVHLEYMRNMGTYASMSISLLREGRLWGLISCHNQAPARVPWHVRHACDFIGQVLSLQIAAKEVAEAADRRSRLRTVQTRLLAHMAAADHFVDGLVSHPDDLLGLTGANSAAVVANGVCMRIGDAPSELEISGIVAWLGSQTREDVLATDHLAALMPSGEALKAKASGLLAVSISQIHDSYVLWFRPEVVRTVTWGGDPRKRAEMAAGGMRLHPRTSFDAWRQIVRQRSQAWDPATVEAAAELRRAVVDIVLRKAEEMAALSERLASINRELEAFSYSVSHDLRAPFRHIVGYANLLKRFEGERLTERGRRYVDTIAESAVSAGTLVDNLLSFSQMGRAALMPVAVDMNELVGDVVRKMTVEGSQDVRWRINDLAPTRADPVMLRLVVQNLVENALKFTRGRNPAIIEIGCASGEEQTTYWVKDNGTGFDMAYVAKLFRVFQRLHRVEEFEGTGIGLANVKRIVDRHGGRVWADGKVDRGATFFFSLPTPGAA